MSDRDEKSSEQEGGVPDAASKTVTVVDTSADETNKSFSLTKSFTVTWKNLETGVVKTGTFTAKRPGLGAMGRIAVLKAKLNGGETVGTYVDSLHEMLAELQVILVDYPDWWTPDDFFTTDPVVEVARHVRSWLTTFRYGRVV
jgi:hypothetical protein